MSGKYFDERITSPYFSWICSICGKKINLKKTKKSMCINCTKKFAYKIRRREPSKKVYYKNIKKEELFRIMTMISEEREKELNELWGFNDST